MDTRYSFTYDKAEDARDRLKSKFHKAFRCRGYPDPQSKVDVLMLSLGVAFEILAQLDDQELEILLSLEGKDMQDFMQELGGEVHVASETHKARLQHHLS